MSVQSFTQERRQRELSGQTKVQLEQELINNVVFMAKRRNLGNSNLDKKLAAHGYTVPAFSLSCVKQAAVEGHFCAGGHEY